MRTAASPNGNRFQTLERRNGVVKERIHLGLCVACSMTMLLANAQQSDDFITFEAASNEVLSSDPDKPDTVFTGMKLSDYEPAYAYFNKGSSSGQRWQINQDLHNEILRPYNIVRSSKNGMESATVQFQGVTRTSTPTPYTASVTVKFVQSGNDIIAYTVRAASLKPLDVELGMDLDAMVDAKNPRVLPRPLTAGTRSAFNISFIAMRKPAAPVEYSVYEGDSIGETIVGNGDIIVTNAVVASHFRVGYLPDAEWVVVAENCSLADLDSVSGKYHFGKNLFDEQQAYNLKYTHVSSRFGEKTCQFQLQSSPTLVTGVLVEFRQNGENVEAYTSKYRTYKISTTNYVDGVLVDDYFADQVRLGMDFEHFSTDAGSSPLLGRYGSLATSDESGGHGVKDIGLRFRSRATVAREEYMPNAYDDGGVNYYTSIAKNHDLSDLVEVDAFYHNGANKGYYVHGVNLNISGNAGSVQFQDENENNIYCIGLDLKQNGNDIEARTGRYRNWYIKKADDPSIAYGLDFYNYKQYTTASRATLGGFGVSDSATSRGLRNLRLRFATGGVVYAAVSTAKHGGSLTFGGSDGAPLAVRSVDATVFPSNSVVTVNPYASLTLSGHVQNPRWTKYRVMTNGVLKLKGALQTATTDQIDLVGGTLSIREEEESATESDAYLNYVTFMDGANIKGKPARVLNDAQRANWIVTGDSPSICESGLVILAAGGDGERTFTFNVNDVSDGSDFFVTGNIVDYHSFNTEVNGYWNVHVVKNGTGTLELSGDVTLPNEICVSNGVLRLAASDQFKISRKRQQSGENTKAAIWLAGGGLETASDTVNSIGALVVKESDSPLVLGNGSTLTLASCSFEEGASLLVSDNLGSGATLRIESGSISKIRCGADRFRVREGADGGLEPFIPGFQISIR